MPWERQPAWLYLPHLTEGEIRVGDGAYGSLAEPGAEDADERSEPGQQGGYDSSGKVDQMRTSHGRADGCAENRPGAIAIASTSSTTRASGSAAGSGCSSAAGALRDRHSRADRIRGQSDLPGGCNDSSGVVNLARHSIRGQASLPGAGSEQSGGLASVNGGGEATTTSSESHGALRGSRGRDREARRRHGASSNIQRSLEDHAERVAEKKRRLGDVPPPATPAERMAALRQRIASRRQGGAAEPHGDGACAAAATAEAHHNNGAAERAGEPRQLIG